MKKWKKGLALAGAAFILVIFCMPMYFALTDQFSMEKFMASLMAALFAAVMAYAMWLVYRVLNKRTGTAAEGEIKNVIFDIGRVLVDFDWKAYLKEFGFSKEEKMPLQRLFLKMKSGMKETEAFMGKRNMFAVLWIRHLGTKKISAG